MMARFTVRAFWICWLVLVVGLSCRLVWTASHSQAGSQVLGELALDEMLGLLGRVPTKVPARAPIEQADFWLAEVERVLSRCPDDAELAMGAAWVLDGPASDYLFKSMQQRSGTSVGGWFAHSNYGDLERSENAFESRCRDRCLDLAARATQLDPANVHWWRLRALLLWRSPIYLAYGAENTPRDQHWREILQECAAHDPENALYDYLAACHYWESNAGVVHDRSGLSSSLRVTDPGRFALGNECFAKGQAKRLCAVGDAGFTSAATFLACTELPLVLQERIVNSVRLTYRQSGVLHDAAKWQAARADAEADSSQVRSSLALRRQTLHMLDQYQASDPSAAYDAMAVSLRADTTDTLRTFARRRADALTTEELRAIDDLDSAARLDRKVLEQAGRAIAVAAPQRGTGQPRPIGPAMAMSMAAVAFLPAAAIVLVLIAAVALFVSRFARSREHSPVGFFGHCLALFAAGATTIIAFGLAPSQVIDRDVQAWALTLLLFLVPLVSVACATLGWRRQGRGFRFSLRAMLTTVFVLCVLLGLVAATRPREESFQTFPFMLSIPPRHAWGLAADVWAEGILSAARWVWVLMQWLAYHGPYLTVALWAVFVALLLRWKMLRVQRQTGSPPLTVRQYLGAVGRSLGRSALVLSALAVLLYLIIAPRVVNFVDQELQTRLAFLRQPAAYWQQLDHAVQQVRSDAALMAQLHQAVAAEMSETPEPE